MNEKVRFFVKIDGYTIPVHVQDVEKAFDVLGIQKDYLHAIESKISNGHAISSYNQLTSGDIMKFVLDHPQDGHSTHTLAEHFGIDIGKGMKNKTHLQRRAYSKIFSNFASARKQVSKRIEGKWIKKGSGFKNQTSIYYFKKIEGEKSPEQSRL